jgi:hypothetical protein
VVLAGSYLAAWHSISRAERAWARQVEPMESFIARYPPEPDSPAAISLDDKTRLLGIGMILRPGEEDREGPHDDLLKELGDFITDHERARTDELAALPSEARTLLERERSHLAAIETQILEGGPLRWEHDATRGPVAPMPRLLAHRQIHTLLLARAWEAARRGRKREADRALEASWVLGASLEVRPDLISRLIALVASMTQHQLLRAARLPEERWLPRMQERGFADSLQTALQLEAWGWARYAVSFRGPSDVEYAARGETPPSAPADKIGRFLTAPYMRLSFAGMSKNLLRASQELRVQSRCDFDARQYSEEFERSFPRWNILGRMASPSLLRSWTSLRQADFDRELTEQVLLLRSHRETSGSWPAGSRPSRVCEGILWMREPQSDGSLTVQSSGPPFAADGSKRNWSFRLQP